MKKNIQAVALKSVLSSEPETFTTISTAALIAKNAVPVSHKKIADSYIIIKRIFKFQAVQAQLTEIEKNLLAKYSFEPLAYTDMNKMNEEISVLKDLSNSEDKIIASEADEIMQIRTKELKFINSSQYKTSELNNGYIALERYFEEITKY